MSAKTPAVGIDHPTVVPANFDPEDGSTDGTTTEDAGAADDA